MAKNSRLVFRFSPTLAAGAGVFAVTVLAGCYANPGPANNGVTVNPAADLGSDNGSDAGSDAGSDSGSPTDAAEQDSGGGDAGPD